MSRRALWAALAAAVAVRLAFSVWAWHNAPLPVDSDAYETFALSLLERGEYALKPGAPSAIREPVYPLLIAAVYGLSGGRRPWAVLLLQALLGAATAWFCAQIALRLHGPRAALLAAWIFALYPYSIYYSAYFFRETLMTFLAAALAFASLKWTAPGREADASALWGGVCAAALGLANSALLPACALCGAALALAAPKAARLKRAALYFAPIVLGVGLWSARNLAALGRPIPGSTHGGHEFYQALVIPPAELGTARQTERLGQDPFYAAVSRLPEAERNELFLKACLVIIAQDPALYASRVAARVIKFWRLWPYPRRYNLPYPLVALASLASDGWIVLLGLWGLWALRGRWGQAPAVWALAVGVTATYAALHAVIRYRMPLMAPMIALAAGMLLELPGGFKRLGKRLKIPALAALLFSCALPARAADGPLDRALEAELSRAMGELKADGYPPPYFTSLAAQDTDSWERRCVLGALGLESATRQRVLSTDLRVGSRELDNHPVGGVPANLGRLASLEDDEFSLRHGLWRLLDGAYKTASADFLRKQALRVSRGKTEYDTDDLTKEAPLVRRATRPQDPWTRAALEELCLAASRPLRAAPGLLHAESAVRVRRQWTRLKDSDGTRADFGRESAEIEMDAIDISTDGTRLYATRRWLVPSPEDLPSAGDLSAAARSMAEDLVALKAAASTSPFSAPALLDPAVAAAVLLAVGQRLSGEEQRNPAGAQTFRSRMGQRVLPADFTVEDDPGMKRFGPWALSGHYELDDEGVPAKKAVLIQDGILKGLLLSRYPVIGFSKSNGHGRATPGTRAAGWPGVLRLSTRKPRTEEQLLKELRSESRRRGKPYGLWVKKLRHFSQQQGTGGHASIRLMPGLLYLVEASSGKLTLVRDLDAVGTPLVLMGNMLSAGDDPQAKNFGGAVPVSAIAPSLLLADLELQRAETKPEKAPLLAPPPAPEAAPTRKSPPIVPQASHVQVNRYRLRGFGRSVPGFVMDGLLELRQHVEGKDLILDAKLRGRSLSELGGAVRRMDASIERLAQGKPVEKAVLAPTMTETSYKAQYGAGWP